MAVVGAYVGVVGGPVVQKVGFGVVVQGGYVVGGWLVQVGGAFVVTHSH